MSAIEYGSYYWCVMLNPTEDGAPGDIIHLHADAVAIDPTGTLTFTSVGRRVAGTPPANGRNEEGGASKQSAEPAQAASPNGDAKSEHGQMNKGGSAMIYVAFARGEWRSFFAAKLQDGAPASIEHWNSADGRDELAALPHEAGAVGYVPATAH